MESLLTAEEISRARGGVAREPAQPFSSGNRVDPLIDGEEMMRALQTDIGAAGPRDSVHIAAWTIDALQALQPGSEPEKRLDHLLGDAAGRGVDCRVLLWDASRALGDVRRLNRRSAALLRARGVHVILDSRHPFAGAHHQKAIAITHDGRPVAYVGGMDVAPDRWDTQSHDGDVRRRRRLYAGWHDVHARLEGPAAWEVGVNFRQHLNEGPAHKNPRPPPAVQASPETQPVASGGQLVQILRTSSHTGGIQRRFAQYAPRGEQTYRAAILKAIARARHFIYIEDQYLVSLEIAGALTEALDRIRHLVVLVPAHGPGPEPLRGAFAWHQNRVVDLLKARNPRRVHIFHIRQPSTGEPVWVHSKIMVIDDVLAIVGSANLNRRSLEHDFELGVAVTAAENGAEGFATRLRSRLWAEHLGLEEADVRLSDPDGLINEWDRQAEDGRFRLRPHPLQPRPRRFHLLWDLVIDPGRRAP